MIGLENKMDHFSIIPMIAPSCSTSIYRYQIETHTNLNQDMLVIIIIIQVKQSYCIYVPTRSKVKHHGNMNIFNGVKFTGL